MIVKAQVLALSATYGDLDGEDNYNYATVFAQVYKTMTTDQKTKLTALRNRSCPGTYSDGTAFDYSVCTTPFLYSGCHHRHQRAYALHGKHRLSVLDRGSRDPGVGRHNEHRRRYRERLVRQHCQGTPISKTFTVTNVGTSNLLLSYAHNCANRLYRHVGAWAQLPGSWRFHDVRCTANRQRPAHIAANNPSTTTIAMRAHSTSRSPAP